MNSIEIGPIKRQLPSAWNELTRKQLFPIAKGFLARITAADFKVQLLKAFLRINKRYLRKIDAESVFFLSETLNFVLEENKLTSDKIVSSVRKLIN